MAKIIERIKNLIIQYREIVSYLFFGVLTTAVNFGSYYICHTHLGMGKTWAEAVAWFVSVLFAYVTNKKYVFDDQSTGFFRVVKTIVSFFGFRAITGAIDLILFDFFIDHMNDYVAKILISIIIIILNYVFSKLFIFRKKSN